MLGSNALVLCTMRDSKEEGHKTQKKALVGRVAPCGGRWGGLGTFSSVLQERKVDFYCQSLGCGEYFLTIGTLESLGGTGLVWEDAWDVSGDQSLSALLGICFPSVLFLSAKWGQQITLLPWFPLVTHLHAAFAISQMLARRKWSLWRQVQAFVFSFLFSESLLFVLHLLLLTPPTVPPPLPCIYLIKWHGSCY
jgi:hypothetical protein